jgi:uncharacterized membrane protein YfcA
MPSLSAVPALVALGLAAGLVGGMFGIGGGLIMVPALYFLFGFDLKTATGTSLFAQLLPVAILGVREYWQRGEVALGSGLWIALGLFGGSILGAKLTGALSPANMKRLYGVFLVLVGLYFLLATPSRTATAPKAAKAQVQRPPLLS